MLISTFYITLQFAPTTGVSTASPSAPTFTPKPRRCASKFPPRNPMPVSALRPTLAPTGPKPSPALKAVASAQAPRPGPAIASAPTDPREALQVIGP